MTKTHTYVAKHVTNICITDQSHTMANKNKYKDVDLIFYLTSYYAEIVVRVYYILPEPDANVPYIKLVPNLVTNCRVGRNGAR